MNKRTGLIAAIVSASLLALPSMAHAQTSDLVINLSPEFDYRVLCPAASGTALSRDWAEWDGAAPPIAPERMFNDATLYLEGSTATNRNWDLARRMLEFLAQSGWSGRDQALYELGQLHLDPRSGAHDAALAVDLLKEAVSLNNTAAAALLGKTYLLGEDLPADDLLADQYLRIGATANDVDSTLALAKLYNRRPDLQPERGAGENYFKLALTTIYRNVANGDCGTLTFLGDIFADSDLNNYDPARAIAWYEASYKAGDVGAALDMANIYGDPGSSLFNYAMARNYLDAAAQSGRVSAMVDLAELDLLDPTQTRRKEAQSWLERAIAHQDMSAYETLVSLALGAYGGTIDAGKAYGYLQQAAALPNVSYEILSKLAAAQSTGVGTDVNLVAAYQNYKRASQLGDSAALVGLYDLTALGIVGQGDDALAYLRAAADAGVSDAMMRLGDVYMCGVQVARDATVATDWYERAAAAGNVSALLLRAKAALAENDDPATYYQYLTRAADVGDAEAMILLSDAYANGIGVQPDAAQAEAMQRRALENPTTKGAALLAMAQLALKPGSADGPATQEAMDLLEQAAAIGNVSALFQLGTMYLDQATPEGAANGLTRIVAAARAGHVGAMLRLAELQVDPIQGGGQDWQGWLSEAVTLGNVRAMLLQASHLTDARQQALFYDAALKQVLCDPKDAVSVAEAIAPLPQYTAQAAKLIAHAAETDTDDVSVLYKLGTLIGNGLLGADRAPGAMEFFQRAAQGGKVEAMRALGMQYFRATLVPQNIERARDWLMAAARAGDQGAMKELGVMITTLGANAMGLDEVVDTLEAAVDVNADGAATVLADVLTAAASVDSRYQERAGAWLQKAAEAGDANAMLMLSNAYALGIGVEKSDEASADWLRRSAEAGYPEAFSKYAMVLELGLGTERDAQQARYWLSRAEQEPTL